MYERRLGRKRVKTRGKRVEDAKKKTKKKKQQQHRCERQKQNKKWMQKTNHVNSAKNKNLNERKATRKWKIHGNTRIYHKKAINRRKREQISNKSFPLTCQLQPLD